jgi:two-component system, cell cycle response regulator
MSILVADDDEASRRLLEAVLKKLGYAVTLAVDGNDALAQLEKDGSPELVLLDWIMPGIDGIEVCRRYRELHPDTAKYIIMLTAKDSKSDTVEGLVAGANDYITKPFNNSELIARLNAGRRFVDMQKKVAAHVQELHEAHDHIRQLQSLLPVCMQCQKLRTDRRILDRIAQYISLYPAADFRQNICPECMEKASRQETKKA